MSNPVTPLTVTIWEDGSVFVMARVLGHLGTAVTQATLTAITCQVFDTSTSPPAVVASPAVTIATSVFDTLQTSDPRWTRDATGYNFAFTLPASAFPAGARRYRAEFIFDPLAGDNFPFVVEVETVDLLSS